LGLIASSATLLTLVFAFYYAGRIFRTQTSQGPFRAISSFFGNIAWATVAVIVSIWILGWIATLQSSPIPSSISNQVPNLAIIAIATAVGAIGFRQSGVTRRWVRTSPFVIPEGKGPAMEGTKLSLKQDTVGVPIYRDGRAIGAVLLGPLSTSFVTPMGAVSATIPGPVTTVGVPFQGRRTSTDEAVRLTGKTPDQLAEESRSHQQDLDVGRIRVRDGCMGDRWKIGPLIFDWDADGEHHPKERWLVKGLGTSYVTTDGHRATAKWNGSNLEVGDGMMSLANGSDSFSYSPTEVKTNSPHHTLQITDAKIILDARKFTLKIADDNVILRTEKKTLNTTSRTLANDLRTLLTGIAKKQIKDVMEGNPIDLEEMFNATDLALSKPDYETASVTGGASQ
ncbi:MAG TPA: hypothetical protein VFV92_05375, partial [Candidatus Bathyarchaeia archaeon]|nr:hypothetical protein [Candidatus Bathyarchaeia archaeon]